MIGNYRDELKKHAAEYPEEGRVPLKKQKQAKKQVQTWFMLEWINPRTGTTIVAEVIKKYVKDPSLRAKVSKYNHIFYSTFIATRHVSDYVLVVAELGTFKQYRVRFRNKLPNYSNTLVVSGYIHPWEADGTHAAAGIVGFQDIDIEKDMPPEVEVLLFGRTLKEQQEGVNNVKLPNRLVTYLRSQPIEFVNSISDFLNISGGTKEGRIRAIESAISARGADILGSLSEEERSCLLYVYGSDGRAVKYKLLQNRFSADDYGQYAPQPSRSTIGRLREKGMLLVGKKFINGKQYRVAAVPEEILPALDRLNAPSARQDDPPPSGLASRFLRWRK